MAKQKRHLGSNNPRLDINLKEIFGKNLPNDESLRTVIGQSIVEKILERTEKGQFLAQSKGAGRYSKDYVESDEFKIFGKSQGDVNLTLKGDMLGQMRSVTKSRNVIRIDWNSSLQAAKAHGHITGNVGKKRDFLGLTKKEIEELKKEFSEDVASAPQDRIQDNPLVGQFLELIRRQQDSADESANQSASDS